jgi:hypothetical protein
LETNGVLPLTDRFFYSHESQCIQAPIKDKKIAEAKVFNLIQYSFIVVK